MVRDKELYSFITDAPDGDSLWAGRYKIPWDEPEFSRRMLAEHLSQEHDLASRRTEIVKQQVAWIHETIRGKSPCRLLDIGCGPGLYLKEFEALLYDCCGIDFSPASIEYARGRLSEQTELIHGNILGVGLGQGYSLAMMLYGELNVFSPSQCGQILSKAFDALSSGGKLLLEIQKYDHVKNSGGSPNSWYKAGNGLFGDSPHICLIENHWFENETTALQQFLVIESSNGRSARYRSTTKAWSDQQIIELLAGTGFVNISFMPEWPDTSGYFSFLTADKP